MKQTPILLFTLAFLFVLLFVGLGTGNYTSGEVILDEIIIDETIIYEEEVEIRPNYFTIPRNDDWICFDYATAYMEANPEFGILIITSPENKYFDYYNGDEDANHAVNYRFNKDKSIVYHDEMYYAHYIQTGWQFTQDNWYFAPYGFVNKWDKLTDNKQEIYNGL